MHVQTAHTVISILWLSTRQEVFRMKIIRNGYIRIITTRITRIVVLYSESTNESSCVFHSYQYFSFWGLPNNRNSISTHRSYVCIHRKYLILSNANKCSRIKIAIEIAIEIATLSTIFRRNSYISNIYPVRYWVATVVSLKATIRVETRWELYISFSLPAQYRFLSVCGAMPTLERVF